MSKASQRSFISGELAPALHHRAGLAKYATGLTTCKNFFMKAQGGLYNRPGLRHVGEIVDSGVRTRLVPFSFNTEQTYILEFGHQVMRVIKDGAYVLDSTSGGDISGVGITQANPAVARTISHNFSTGDQVYISGVLGMTEVNNQTFTITVLTADTYSLDGVNSTGFTAYTSSGVARKLYEMATSFTEANLFDTTENVYKMGFTQNADTLSVTLHGYSAAEITRTDHDEWTYNVIDFDSTVDPPTITDGTPVAVSTVATTSTGPNPALVTTAAPHLLSESDTFTIDGVTGTIAGDINGNTYRANSVTSTTFIIADANGVPIIFSASSGTGGTIVAPALNAVGAGGGTHSKTYRYVVTATDIDGQESSKSVEAAITISSLSETFGVRLEWNEVTDAEFYTVYKDGANGTGVYGFIGESKAIYFEDYNVAPDLSRTPPEDNTPFTADNPAVVGYYQQRRVFANTPLKPQTTFFTQVGIYNSMRYSIPARDADSLELTINSRQINEIRHIIDLDDLLVFTAGAEYRITEGQDFVLTPSTVGAKAQSYSGSSWVRPITTADTVFFVQEKGNRLRDYDYTIERTKYGGVDLTVMSEHLFGTEDAPLTIVEMAYAKDPYGILWCVMSDGGLIGMTYQKEHQVWGWHRHETDGYFESVATVREGDRDAVYFVVRRTINGSDLRTVERLEPRYVAAAEDAFFVDAGLSYNGSPATMVRGLWHLEGETVKALADGIVINDLTVSNGAVTIPNAASKIHVGLGYTGEIETLSLDSNETTLEGHNKNVAELTIRFLNSRGGWAGPDTDNMTEIKPRYDSDDYDAIALYTRAERVTIDADWNDDGKVVLQQRDPLPMSVTTITPEFDVGG